jgi:ParB family chromosome partitioning protein
VASRADVKWVPIDKVIPNPLNPRRNDAIKTEEMQEILRRRGWEEPITVYRKANMYVILAGHRRRYAAKEAGMKEVPVYEVEAPKDHQEEIERIASLQRGRVDWTPYEWAKFTYERWIAWSKPPYSAFSKVINIDARRIKEYVTIFEYYPREEIEHKLENGSLNITNLANTAYWIEKLEQQHPIIVQDMGKDLIRQTMVGKMERGLIKDSDSRRSSDFPGKAIKEDVMNFLTSSTMSLREAQEPYGTSKKKDMLRSVNIRMGNLSTELLTVKGKSKRENEALYHNLNELLFSIKKKMKEIESEEPSVNERWTTKPRSVRK